MERVYSVPGISCDHCRQAITDEVVKVSGVDRVEVSIDDRTVRVEGDAADDAVLTAIGEAGYEVDGGA